GARSTIDSALHRREHEGVIRRVIRGIYDYPRYSEALGGPTSPDIDKIAHALARKFAWRIQPNGATAQNLLGLSTQVPAHAVYLSDGPDRSYTVGRTTLDFEHTALKRSEDHTSELQSPYDLVCRLLLEKKKLQYLGSDASMSWPAKMSPILPTTWTCMPSSCTTVMSFGLVGSSENASWSGVWSELR